MNDILNKLINYILVLVVTYIVLAFTTAEPNPLKWYWVIRLIAVMVAISALAIFQDDGF